jgi:hypothetical protein
VHREDWVCVVVVVAAAAVVVVVVVVVVGVTCTLKWLNGDATMGVVVAPNGSSPSK